MTVTTCEPCEVPPGALIEPDGNQLMTVRLPSGRGYHLSATGGLGMDARVGWQWYEHGLVGVVKVLATGLTDAECRHLTTMTPEAARRWCEERPYAALAAWIANSIDFEGVALRPITNRPDLALLEGCVRRALETTPPMAASPERRALERLAGSCGLKPELPAADLEAHVRECLAAAERRTWKMEREISGLRERAAVMEQQARLALEEMRDGLNARLAEMGVTRAEVQV